MMNKVVLIGRATHDPEMRYMQNKKAVANVNIAVNRNYKNAQGEREADFIRLSLFGQPAENFANWVKKGALIAVAGSIQTSNYEKDGQRINTTQVVVNEFQLLESRNSEGNGGSAPAANNGNFNNGGNYQNNQQQGPNFAREESPFGNSNPMEISDDDLPF